MTLPTPPTQSKPNPPAPPAARPNGAKPAAGNGAAQPRAAPASVPGAAPLATTDALLARIATALERLAVNTPAPNYKRGLAAFKGFDFARAAGCVEGKIKALGPTRLKRH